MAPHRITDEQCELIENVFPARAATGHPPVNPRDMMDAIFWRLRTVARSSAKIRPLENSLLPFRESGIPTAL
jgi:transposase